MTNPFKNFYHSYYIKDHITNPNIIVGDYSYYAGFYHGKHFEDNVWYLDATEEVSDKLIIGKFCSIATGVIFMMGGNQGHRHEWLSTYPFYWDDQTDWGDFVQNGYSAKGNTLIGDDVWIGASALIMPGVCVGNGAIIAARAVVTKSVEPYTIVGGNPARLIKKRFDDPTIALLQQLCWWDWPVEKIKQHMALLCSNNAEALRALRLV
ncbi:MAG: hypothetical protein A3F17_06470 [Gammaproteobacteria bacterium RIFCSPHIGHO2_12_FULL_41_15]|nr:MAG: hypothetical protein A3F17_06470 [Gammaproteobacteria bacterium RIFCSPHIGHO2_12_FULL_41_15]